MVRSVPHVIGGGWGRGSWGRFPTQASIGEQGVRKASLPWADFFTGGKREEHSKPSFIGWFSTTFIYSG